MERNLYDTMSKKSTLLLLFILAVSASVTLLTLSSGQLLYLLISSGLLALLGLCSYLSRSLAQRIDKSSEMTHHFPVEEFVDAVIEDLENLVSESHSKLHTIEEQQIPPHLLRPYHAFRLLTTALDARLGEVRMLRGKDTPAARAALMFILEQPIHLGDLVERNGTEQNGVEDPMEFSKVAPIKPDQWARTLKGLQERLLIELKNTAATASNDVS